MARSSLMPILAFGALILLGFSPNSSAHYTDDSDYEDLDFYKDSPVKRLANGGGSAQDDFYLLSEAGEPEERNRRVASSSKEEEMNKRPIIERVFRYTKYRISGHDYDELEYNKDLCSDERTVWSHCVCQFTCSQPDIVDCFEPCNSGCECREQFVYDERNKECVKPEKCPPPDDDYLFY